MERARAPEHAHRQLGGGSRCTQAAHNRNRGRTRSEESAAVPGLRAWGAPCRRGMSAAALEPDETASAASVRGAAAGMRSMRFCSLYCRAVARIVWSVPAWRRRGPIFVHQADEQTW